MAKNQYYRVEVAYSDGDFYADQQTFYFDRFDAAAAFAATIESAKGVVAIVLKFPFIPFS